MAASPSAPFRVLVALAALTLGTVLPEGAPLGSRPLAAQIFPSSHSANLPTTTTLPAGDLLFEISHRFTPAISDGSEAFWGLDGPVINRLGLAYAVTDAALLGVRRSNLVDNVELWGSARLLEGGSEGLLFALGVTGAVAWNTASTGGVVDGRTDNETQAYLQGVVDLGLKESVSLGIVPTYLHNPRIRDLEADDTFVLGLHGRVAATDNLALIAEWIVSEELPDRAFDSGALGLEIQTRGHFFKLLLTNQTRMNPSQLLGGSAVEFTPDEWRIGFNITRRIAF